LTTVSALVGPKLENEGFARTGGGLHNHVISFPQGDHGVLLPEVRNGDLVQGRQLVE
jgi:hypothetical protein